MRRIGILALMICGCSSPSRQQSCTPSTGSTGKYVVDEWKVPVQGSDYAYDLNGDGIKDNALGALIVAFAGKGLDTQAGITQAVKEGAAVELLQLGSSDATFQSDTCASAVGYVGQKTTSPPKFDGSDVFAKDSSVAASGQFTGPIQTGTFNSSSPVTAQTPVTLTLKLPLLGSDTPVELDLTASHIQFTVESSGDLMQGQLNGAIQRTDVQNKLVPALAQTLTVEGQSNPNVLPLFDTGGAPDPSCAGACKNPDGSCALQGDKKIDVCEVTSNDIIKSMLVPDVQLFTSSDPYDPSAANTMMDSISLGLSFCCTQTSY